MQAVAQDAISQENSQSIRLVITGETLAIVALVCVSLLLRLVALGNVSIAETEARQALSAWRSVDPQASGEPIVSNSPIVFWGEDRFRSVRQ
jgi:hypothetical protein